MTVLELLNSSDYEIAEQYREWSEATYCAGWLGNGEQEFVDYMLNEYTPATPALVEYERNTVSKIRNILANKLGSEREE
jgi:hypothetical protein